MIKCNRMHCWQLQLHIILRIQVDILVKAGLGSHRYKEQSESAKVLVA